MFLLFCQGGLKGDFYIGLASFFPDDKVLWCLLFSKFLR